MHFYDHDKHVGETSKFHARLHDFTNIRDSEGSYFIDNDGSAFRIVLNFLRHGRLNISDVEFCRHKKQLMHDA